MEKGSGKQRQWVFRLPKEKWNKEIIQPVPKGKEVSVMSGQLFGEMTGQIFTNWLVILLRRR